MKKATAKDKKRVIEFLRAMDWVFSTQNFVRTVTFKEEDTDGSGPEMDRCLDIVVNEEYKSLHINVYPCLFERDLETRAYMIIHELTHVLTTPIQKIAEDLHEGKFHSFSSLRKAVEESTTGPALVISRLMGNDMKYAKDAYLKFTKP